MTMTMTTTGKEVRMKPLPPPTRVCSPQEASLTWCLCVRAASHPPCMAVHGIRWHGERLPRAETEGCKGKGCALDRRHGTGPGTCPSHPRRGGSLLPATWGHSLTELLCSLCRRTRPSPAPGPLRLRPFLPLLAPGAHTSREQDQHQTVLLAKFLPTG